MEEQRRLDAITDAVIGAAMSVHRVLGPGLLESAYERCLDYELKQRGLSVVRQQPLAFGLLINFHAYALRQGVRRVVNQYPDSPLPLRSLRSSAFSAVKG